jgi:hypothetical protein
MHSSASGELHFTNTSEKGIVALEADAEVMCMHSRQSIKDHFDRLFFKANGLAPGESFAHFIPDWDQESVPDQNFPAHIDVKIVFIQFEDGTIWGRQTHGAGAHAQRKTGIAVEALSIGW